jgi:hypothetical protein
MKTATGDPILCHCEEIHPEAISILTTIVQPKYSIQHDIPKIPDTFVPHSFYWPITDEAK